MKSQHERHFLKSNNDRKIALSMQVSIGRGWYSRPYALLDIFDELNKQLLFTDASPLAPLDKGLQAGTLMNLPRLSTTLRATTMNTNETAINNASSGVDMFLIML